MITNDNPVLATRDPPVTKFSVPAPFVMCISLDVRGSSLIVVVNFVCVSLFLVWLGRMGELQRATCVQLASTPTLLARPIALSVHLEQSGLSVALMFLL